MDQQQVRWRFTRGQVLWSSGIVIVLIVSILVGYRYGITLWNWLQLLIIPAAIAAGGVWFNRQQRERELGIADQRTQTDREIADQRRQDDIMQAYLDQVGQLLLDKDRPLRKSEEDAEVRTLARARTLTILSQLDGVRKGELIRFLLEAALIRGSLRGSREERLYPIISLEDADLRGIDLFGYDLSETVLTAADLSGADLSACGFEDTYLSGAFLIDADLPATHLKGADLNGATLRGAALNGSDFRGAALYGANLVGADLTNANLLGADLTNADLTGAIVTGEQLAECQSLKGATMPDGSKYS